MSTDQTQTSNTQPLQWQAAKGVAWLLGLRSEHKSVQFGGISAVVISCLIWAVLLREQNNSIAFLFSLTSICVFFAVVWYWLELSDKQDRVVLKEEFSEPADKNNPDLRLHLYLAGASLLFSVPVLLYVINPEILKLLANPDRLGIAQVCVWIGGSSGACNPPPAVFEIQSWMLLTLEAALKNVPFGEFIARQLTGQTGIDANSSQLGRHVQNGLQLLFGAFIATWLRGKLSQQHDQIQLAKKYLPKSSFLAAGLGPAMLPELEAAIKEWDQEICVLGQEIETEKTEAKRAEIFEKIKEKGASKLSALRAAGEIAFTARIGLERPQAVEFFDRVCAKMINTAATACLDKLTRVSQRPLLLALAETACLLGTENSTRAVVAAIENPDTGIGDGSKKALVATIGATKNQKLSRELLQLIVAGTAKDRVKGVASDLLSGE